jgi:predicted transglutaminase-like cysteine proteinase
VGRSRFLKVATKVVVLVCLAGATVGTPALAGSKAPLGYQLMCLKTPHECEGGGKSSVEASTELMVTLKRVNSLVNSSITPRNDAGADVWSASSSSGDCEDYVLAKRRALIKSGLPASALRIAYVKTRGGVGHAILVVKTSKGEFVLDNLNRAIRPLSQTGYRIISISGADPKQWS